MAEIPAVLIIDDDIAICNLIDEALKGNGYLCEIALNASEAFIKIQNHHYDIALLDIKLPDKSGLELLKISQPFFHNTSIIMMTAVKDFNIAVQAMKMGATDYVVKPFTIKQITTSITKILKARDSQSLFSVQTERIGYPNQGEKVINQSISTINALAIGVDAQVDYFDFHSKSVTEKTVSLARRFGLPEKEIKKWENSRYKIMSQKRSYIKSILNKLEQNPLAQVLLGLTHSNITFLREKGEQN